MTETLYRLVCTSPDGIDREGPMLSRERALLAFDAELGCSTPWRGKERVRVLDEATWRRRAVAR
ncbi:MAG TPA: hypothetical protein VL652_34830 [Kutzneria sp.]|jgi:hypothetical protein|nr:hypothetical protein [Kutzneria sp.]